MRNVHRRHHWISDPRWKTRQLFQLLNQMEISHLCGTSRHDVAWLSCALSYQISLSIWKGRSLFVWVNSCNKSSKSCLLVQGIHWKCTKWHNSVQRFLYHPQRDLRNVSYWSIPVEVKPLHKADWISTSVR